MNFKNFVIVGAGPIGLWTAIQINKRFPNSHITIYEKYETYKRQHVLKIQHSSLFFGASKKNSQFDKDFFKQVFNLSIKNLKLTPFSKTFISTNTIESNLKDWTIKIGCNIIYKNIESLDELIQNHHPETTFILANGSNSNLRKILLGDNDIQKTDLQHILELKTMINKPMKDLKSVNANGSIKGKLNNLCFEYIGKSQTETTPLNLRIFVTEELYNQIPEATFKNPLNDYNMLPNSVKNDLIKYSELHKISIDELFKNGQITKLQLSVYHALKFSEKYKNVNFFIAGDAAIGVPYFRALNSGFVLSSRLVSILKYSQNLDKAANLYNKYQSIHTNAEETLAKTKNNGLNFYNQLRKMYRFIKN